MAKSSSGFNINEQRKQSKPCSIHCYIRIKGTKLDIHALVSSFATHNFYNFSGTVEYPTVYSKSDSQVIPSVCSAVLLGCTWAVTEAAAVVYVSVTRACVK